MQSQLIYIELLEIDKNLFNQYSPNHSLAEQSPLTKDKMTTTKKVNWANLKNQRFRPNWWKFIPQIFTLTGTKKIRIYQISDIFIVDFLKSEFAQT